MIGQLKHRWSRQQRRRTIEGFVEHFCVDQIARIDKLLNTSLDRVRIARNDDMSSIHNMPEFTIERRS